MWSITLIYHPCHWPTVGRGFLFNQRMFALCTRTSEIVSFCNKYILHFYIDNTWIFGQYLQNNVGVVVNIEERYFSE